MSRKLSGRKPTIFLHKLFFITFILVTTLACSVPRMLFETFVSPADLDQQAVATWEDKYADDYEMEVYDEDESTNRTEDGEDLSTSSSTNPSVQLTPQELINQGTHNYIFTGSTTPMLGNDGTIDDSGICSSDFTSDGVNFQLSDYTVGFLRRIADNQYELVSEAGVRTTLEYTDTGILYYSNKEDGIFLDMELILND